ncbi:hypothetical protein B0H16DRAFT_1459166 [Mycena metata]|uniref:Uncharacterized protein n=1 Tax=Mycena metata TaxID=1033252 RepID=A0AAD7J0B5_9AGAR|nr:hypothetical protein B0H16DRAFT_1459166 [Mycena metata]
MDLTLTTRGGLRAPPFDTAVVIACTRATHNANSKHLHFGGACEADHLEHRGRRELGWGGGHGGGIDGGVDLKNRRGRGRRGAANDVQPSGRESVGLSIHVVAYTPLPQTHFCANLVAARARRGMVESHASDIPTNAAHPLFKPSPSARTPPAFPTTSSQRARSSGKNRISGLRPLLVKRGVRRGQRQRHPRPLLALYSGQLFFKASTQRQITISVLRRICITRPPCRWCWTAYTLHGPRVRRQHIQFLQALNLTSKLPKGTARFVADELSSGRGLYERPPTFLSLDKFASHQVVEC